jgi:hypothetical protein
MCCCCGHYWCGNLVVFGAEVAGIVVVAEEESELDEAGTSQVWGLAGAGGSE